MMGRSQNNSKSGKKNRLLIGCNQGRFNCGRGFDNGGGRYLPPQTSGPTVPTGAPQRRPPKMLWCEICDVKLSSQKNMEQHKIGRRHQWLLKKREELQRPRAINGQESGQVHNSLKSLVVQPQKVQESKKNGCLVENVNSEATVANHKDYLQKDTGKTSEGEPRDNFAAQSHGFKRKVGGAGTGKYMKTNFWIRRPVESSKPEQSIPFTCELCSTRCQSQVAFESHLSSELLQLKLEHLHSNQALDGEGGYQALKSPDINALSNYAISQVQVHAIAPPSDSAPVASQILARTPVVGTSFELQFEHVSASQIQESEAIAHHAIQNSIGKTKDQLRSISVELDVPSGSSINTQTEDVSSDSAAIIATAPLPGPVASQILAPTPMLGSSTTTQVQVSEATAHLEIQNSTRETKDQSRSISVELDVPVGSSINTRTQDVSSDSAAITVAPPPGPVVSQILAPTPVVGSSSELKFQHISASQIQVSEVTAHQEIENPIQETKCRSRSISVELDVPGGSSIKTQTKDVSSDSAAIAIAPPGPTASQVFPPTAAGRSSFEPQIQHVLRASLSEAIERCQSQNPIEETNIQMLSSVLVEFNAPAGSSTNTQTADGSSKAEENMEVLTTELGISQLAEVTICLKCGDRGFPETLVFCSKCQVYALHRYCLDGPVIFVEDVSWFCEDCEAKVLETSSHDQSMPLPSRTSDSVNLANDAIQSRGQTNCINRVKKNKQWKQEIGKKLKKRKVISAMKVLLSDCHGSPHHEQTQSSDNCEEENKFKKECEPVPKVAANSCEGSDNVQISQVAANDDVNFVESDCHADAQPIADPIWRGSLYLCNQSIGTVSGLLAHLSSLACSKVLEETKHFPEVLLMDLQPRSAVWPKGFKNCGPNDQSIALYFFPENERAEKAFDKLVDDIIHFDLAMRTVVENAELLVFPSTVLPVQYRRFQAKYYLWGVFRALQTSPTTNDVVCGEDTASSH